MVENKNRIAAGTQAKHKPSSAQVSANPQINKLINNIAKNTSYAYSSAVARAKLHPLDELHRRVFKKLRPDTALTGSKNYPQLSAVCRR